ncbi:UvrD-helicase domain-containing protein [Marinomonas sp. NPDC078689]|uniref:UvrD-helicase domain-containing protein n=1 Tax=Marinomonas sp. NPDC078689 TaxID=3364147 RepID=UPI0037C841C8
MTKNEIEELGIQKNINQHIDGFKSFRFNAGAGAGKTYALIETLKYVTTNKIAATKSPQKVACITYTNVAVNEIKNRLGNSDIVDVSTIHERLWEIIKRAQPELLICHKEKIEEVIEQIEQDLLSSDKAKFFNALDDSKQQEFIEFTKETRDLFYQSKKLSTRDFNSAYTNNTDIHKPDFLLQCLKNVKNFQYVVGLFYKKQKLEECLVSIEVGENKKVKYESKVNSDRLHYMKFSHDTLLEYGLKLVQRYPTLCRIIIDTYPYFLIDEYQDTHECVVKFVKIIHDYAIENKKAWVVGYFGDTAQCIYDSGVGRHITKLHNGLDTIKKKFNRRSHQQIIDVANKIRDDEIEQVPIFDNRNNGSVGFLYNNDAADKLATAKAFLSEYKKDLIKDNEESEGENHKETKIHCLVLTNRLLASFNDFDDVYKVFQKSDIFYNDLNIQILSQDLEKLHPTVLAIYRVIKLYQDIRQGKISYYYIFGSSKKRKDITFAKASLVISELKNKNCESFKDWIDLIYDRLESSKVKEELSHVLINRINYDKGKEISSGVFRETLLESINYLMNGRSEDEDKAKEKIDKVLALPIESLINWVNFIDRIEKGEIIYHTYHGTKGEEYKNVAIILEHNFGSKNKDKFKNYFEVVQSNEEGKEQLLADSEDQEKHINTQNLLYVVCSRAIKNLRVLYLDDISEIKEGIESIFGEAKAWPVSESMDVV